MKPTYLLRIAAMSLFLFSGFSKIAAQTLDTTLTTPAATAVDTTPATKPEETKTKKEKDGFNSKSRFGIRAGALYSTQTIDDGSLEKDPESKLGGDLAIVASFPIGGGFLTFQPELHWMQKGYRISELDSLGDASVTLDYLELPLLLRVNFGGSLRVFALGGPSLAYLLGGKYEDDLNSYDLDDDSLSDTEWGVHIGLGVGIGTFELDIRYMQGLSDVSQDDPNVSGVKNSAYGAGITLKF